MYIFYICVNIHVAFFKTLRLKIKLLKVNNDISIFSNKTQRKTLSSDVVMNKSIKLDVQLDEHNACVAPPPFIV